MKHSSKYGTLYYHDTPWNFNALQAKSLEIDSVDSTIENTEKLLNEFCEEKAKEGYKLIASRISVTQKDLKKAYFSLGFITVEHTLEVACFNLNTEKINSIANRFPVIIEDYTQDDISELENISQEAFSFGRFFEDPFIDLSIAQKRNKFWIKDLISQKATIKVIKKKNIAVGFMAYKRQNNRVDLILGGVTENYRHLAYGFWANVLSSLENTNEVHTLISSSNIPILNLYSYFEFEFGNPQFGFHKHL